MKPRFELKKSLYLMLIAALAAGSGNLVASPDDDDDDDRPGQGNGGGGNGGGGGGNEALTADFIGLEPTKGRFYGHYFPFSGGENTALNADVRLALELLDGDDEDAATLKILNGHLGITRDNYKESKITLFIGTDEDGDGSCLAEGPTSMCVIETSGSHDLEINDDNVLHAAWALALREEDDELRGGSGTCWTDFESATVTTAYVTGADGITPIMTATFEIVGGEEGMPEINDGDGCMVGFGHPELNLGDIDCDMDEDGNEGVTTTCTVTPIMMGNWED